MYFNRIIPAALLLASVTAKPTQAEKRQVGGLSPLLGVISQVLPQGSNTGAAVPGLSTLPSSSSDVTAQASCDKALQRVNDAIQLSSALTSKNGGKATTQDILIVLAVLQKSLGENCDVASVTSSAAASSSLTSGIGGGREKREQQESADGPLSGIIGDGGNPNGILGDVTGGGRDDDDDDNSGCAEGDGSQCSDSYDEPSNCYGSGCSRGSDSQKETFAGVIRARAQDTTVLANCTACEAALYSIVQQLQTLFRGSKNTPIPTFGQPRLNEATRRLRIDTMDSAMQD